MIGGALLEFAAWWAVSRKGISIWVAMGIALPALGIAAIAVREPSLSPSVSAGVAVAAGAAAGLALYLATRVFVAAVRPWRTFQRQSVELYARRAGLPLIVAIVLAAVVMAPGEELFWRGLFQAKLSVVLDGRTAGAAIAWAVFALVNLPSRNLAIIAGAVVGGAVWSALSWWTG
ncbi:MAG TPA: CPBP family intramembrane glutamic endopeptidase, partial [Actinomycetota bacterium]|nr:CPBP family intramembrane glutamic endopeptidase [Actinomycetota bacterium]